MSLVTEEDSEVEIISTLNGDVLGKQHLGWGLTDPQNNTTLPNQRETSNNFLLLLFYSDRIIVTLGSHWHHSFLLLTKEQSDLLIKIKMNLSDVLL